MKLFSRNLWIYPILFAVNAIFRLPNYFVYSFKEDEFFYMTAGKVIADGGFIYKNFADIKPPFIYILYSFIYQISDGPGVLYFYILKTLPLFAAFLISVLIYHTVKHYQSNKTAITAALFFVVFSTAMNPTETLPANTEIFSLLFITLSLLFFTMGESSLSSINYEDINRKNMLGNFKNYFFILLSGLSVSFAFLFNMRSGIVVAVFGIFLIYKHFRKFYFIIYGVFISVGFFLPIAILVLYFYQTGNIESFSNWQLIFPKYYVGSYTLLQLITRGVLGYRFFLGLIPLVFFSVYFFRNSGKADISKDNIVLLTLLLCLTYLSAYSGGKHVERYYYSVLLPLVIISAIGFELFMKNIITPEMKVLVLLFLIISPVLFLNNNFFNHNRKTITDVKNEYKEITKYIRKNTDSSDSIYVWPIGNLVYFYSGRKMATPFYCPRGHLVMDKYLSDSGRVEKLWTMFRTEFDNDKPKLVIDYTTGFTPDKKRTNIFIDAELKQFREKIENEYYYSDYIDGAAIYRLKDDKSKK